MTCSVCQSAVPDDARFCPNCGTRAEPPAVPTRELRKTVTVLFCDMTDSTALSGRLDPEPLREVMVRYYALMRSCLERHGGTVEKYIGDAVVAIFGVPVLHEDDALRALRAATEMLDALAPLNLELRALIGVEIGIRIGVNTGEVVAVEDALSGQVLTSGEAVNVAARLQQHAAPGEIILGPVTHNLTTGDTVVAPVGELTLKGKAEPVPAWRLLDLSPGGAAGFPARDEPFFGRSAELEQLTTALDEATGAADCRLVTLQGDAGLGKTRLAAEFMVKATGRGAVVGVGRCPPYGEGRTLYALGEALRQIVDAARDRGALGPEQGFDVRDALAYLESGLLLDGAPGELPDQLTWAATLVLETIGRRHPVVVILDDVQWAKPALLELLGHLAGGITGAPVLMLVLARPDLLETSPSWGGIAPGTGSLVLGPLGAGDARLLVTALSESASPLRAELVEQIVERAEGNPFFLEQLVAIADQGSTDSLPPTVQSVIAARLDLLDPVDREVLLRATVPGRRFSAAELGALLQEDPAIGDPPDQTLVPLTHRRLIVAEHTGERYRFSGALVRDVAYHVLSKRARLRFHERLAGWHRQHPDRHDQVGLHLEQAYRLATSLGPADQQHVRQLRTDAAAALALAGAQALRRSDLHWAADLLTRALDLHDPSSPERQAVTVHLAEARLLLGTDPSALETLRTLADEASVDGDQRTACHVRLLLGALEMPGPSAVEDVLATVPVFESAGDHLGLTRAWLRVGQLRQLGGRYGEAEGLLRRALRHALQTDTQFELATVIGGLATSLWRGPTPAEAAMAGCGALLAEHAVGRRVVRATVNCPLAVLLAYRGTFDEARSLVQTSARIIDQLGHAYGAASMQIFAATVEGMAGRWDAAEVLLRDAAAAGLRLGDTLSSSAAAAGLARALQEQGRNQAALRVTEGTTLTTGDPFLDAEIHGVRARALALRGDREPALRDASRATAAAAGTDSTACQAMAALDRAHVLRALGDDRGSVAAATTAEHLFQAKGHLVGIRWAASIGAQSRDTDVT
ncbi:AAA family ATPase [Peterkaempfera sp. SMS 1(5)a]|uniref:AAA family ATPase n=1 Tax=Peterkaempfera podocarpi TaxID=3232308 RepID=UPI00366AE474